MRLPNIPFEVNVHLRFYVLGVFFHNWFNFKQLIEILNLIVITVETIVIFLRVELY
jgi:hypothetical protein